MTMRAIHLQPRDLGLLGELGEVALMDTAMIHERHFPRDRTGEACLRRLRLYTQHDLVRPIRLTVAFADRPGGRLATIQCLTVRGAEVLAEQTGVRPRRILRSDPRPETLLHRLGMIRVLLILKDACARQQLPAPAFILEQDTNPDVRPGAPLAERFILYEQFPTVEGKTVSCRPDASSWIRIPGVTAGQGPAWHDLLVSWEYDRSTETLLQFSAKVEPYHLFLASECYRRHWPAASNPVVRVFVVVPSEERRDNIIAAIRDRPGAGAFRLAALPDLTADQFLTAPIWHTVTGECRAILKTGIPPP